MHVAQTRAFFQRNLDEAIKSEKNARGVLEAYQKKEFEARKLGNYEAQLQVYTDDLTEVSKRVKRLTQDLARFEQETAEREQKDARARNDEQGLQVFRAWLHGAQLVMEQGTDEEKAAFKKLLKK